MGVNCHWRSSDRNILQDTHRSFCNLWFHSSQALFLAKTVKVKSYIRSLLCLTINGVSPGFVFWSLPIAAGDVSPSPLELALPGASMFSLINLLTTMPIIFWANHKDWLFFRFVSFFFVFILCSFYHQIEAILKSIRSRHVHKKNIHNHKSFPCSVAFCQKRASLCPSPQKRIALCLDLSSPGHGLLSFRFEVSRTFHVNMIFFRFYFLLFLAPCWCKERLVTLWCHLVVHLWQDPPPSNLISGQLGQF